MLTRYQLAGALLLAILTASPALAQGPAQTGTGGGPTTTITAPNTAATGRTKPPGAAAGTDAPDDPQGRTRQQREDTRIQKGICVGCSE